MNRSHHIQIDIPTPCHENWDKMTPCGQGRHCAHCDKTVIDFTTWSDTALYEFFTKEHGKVCGRFHTSQLGRDIRIPPQPHSRLYRMVVAMGLTLIFVQGVEVYGQSRPPVVQHVPDDMSGLLDDINSSISGVVVDEQGKYKASALVHVLRDSVVIASTTTDTFGRYKIDGLKRGDHHLEVVLNDHHIARTWFSVTPEVNIRRNITLYSSLILSSGYITGLSSYEYYPLDPPGTRVFTREEIESLPSR